MAENNEKSSRRVFDGNTLKGVQLRQTQHQYLQTINSNQITFCYGPAGTSKTYTACYAALKMLEAKEIEHVVLCKPIQEAGEKLGFLPGEVDEKIAPYIQSYKTNIEKIVGPEKAKILFDRGVFHFQPLAYMRGNTYDNALMILDEAQNADYKQLMLFVTRMGKDSKVIVAGDVSQHDIIKSKVSLPSFMEMLDGIKGIGTHVFGEKDIVRAKILQDVVNRYDKWKSDNNK
jgi:phosphate starvation-inducible PhoH-like protein